MAPVRGAFSNLSTDDPDLTIQMAHFGVAIQKIMPSVSQDKLKLYVKWMKEYGSN